MDYRDVQKLKAFFSALKDSGFKQNLNQIPSFTTIDGQRTPVDKTYCLELLRKFPQFQSDKFKDDNAIIKYLSDPRNREYILGNFTPQQRVELEKLLEVKPVVEEFTQPTGQQTPTSEQPITGETASTMMPNLPSGGGFTSSSPRVLYTRPAEPGAATAKIQRLNQTPTDKTPAIKTTGISKPYASPPPQPPSAPTRFNFPALKNFGARIGSPAGIFFKKSSTRVAGGLGQMAGGMGRAIVGPGVTGLYKVGGKMLVGGVNVSENLFRQVGGGGFSGRGFFGKNTGRKFILLALGSFLIFGIVFASISGGPTPGGITPVTNNGLDYTLPLRDSSIQPLDIKNQVKAAFPGAKLEYWDDPMIKRSKEAGWNPALVLALWIEESGASHTTLIKNGGSEIPVNGQLTKGHLGCAPLEDQTINESLDCLFKNFKDYTNDQFGQFMARYSGGPADAPFSNNPNFTTNFKKWYSLLVPSGAGALQPVVPSGQSPGKEFALSCPIANENNTCSHFDDPRDSCHCNPSQYLSMAACRADASLNYGIDVGTKASKAALIPYITYQGETTPQALTCQLITAQSATCPESGCEPQQILHYHCRTSKIDLYLQYNHIKANSNFPATISSGQAVGDVANYGSGLRRLNIQVGVNSECAYGQTQFCKRGGDYFQCPLQKESAPDY